MHRNSAPDPRSIRFIAMDMDGTILDAGYRLSPRVKDTLLQLQRGGRKLIIATGRVLGAARNFLQDAFDPDAFVCTNGADIYGAGGQKLAEHHIPSDAHAILKAVSRSHDVLFAWYLGEDWYYERANAYSDFYEKRTGIQGRLVNFDDLDDASIVKCIVIGPRATLLAIRTELAAQAGSLLDTMFSHDEMLEIVAHGVNKRAGLEECLHALGGSLAETIAFGDAENDLDMLKAAAVGVAMGNAPALVKAHVLHIAPSVDDDGVAHFLARYFGMNQ